MPYFQDSDRLRFVNDGQRVTAPVAGGRGCRCIVEKACGETAYIVPEDPNSSFRPRWIDVTELYPEVPKDYKPGDVYQRPGRGGGSG